MINRIERGLLMGLGAFSLTYEKAEAIVNDLVKRGEVRREESGELIDRLMKRGEKEREAVHKMIQEETTRALKAVNFATSKDVEVLSKKLDALAKQLTKDS